jgi:transposase
MKRTISRLAASIIDVAGAIGIEADEFMQHYHKRSNVESAFSAIKRKFGDSVRSKCALGVARSSATSELFVLI